MVDIAVAVTIVASMTEDHLLAKMTAECADIVALHPAMTVTEAWAEPVETIIGGLRTIVEEIDRDEIDCIICFEPIKVYKMHENLACGHICFYEKCIDDWFEKNQAFKKFPFCKAKVY